MIDSNPENTFTRRGENDISASFYRLCLIQSGGCMHLVETCRVLIVQASDETGLRSVEHACPG